MTEIVLEGCEPLVLASHMALIGGGSIAAEALGAEAVRVHWSDGMRPRPILTVDGSDAIDVAAAVRDHAATALDWLSRTFDDDKGTPRGLMSPRRAVPAKRERWQALLDERRLVLDELHAQSRGLDLRMVGGLGEPSHWHRDPKGELRVDWGATRFDMQARNQGSEIVRTKLARLASAVAARTPEGVLSAVTGATVVDDLDRGPGWLTATGMAPPGPFDSALAWCAMWGMSAMPVAARARRASITTGFMGLGDAAEFFVPVVTLPTMVARLRSLCSDARLAAYVRPADPAVKRAAATWLLEHHVRTVATFGVVQVGTSNSPRRSARLGRFQAVSAFA